MSEDLEAQKADFSLENVGKGDVDMFADVSMQQSMEYLRLLALKLYLRNPNQLLRGEMSGSESKNATGDLKKDAIQKIFSDTASARISDLDGKRSIEAIHLAFNEAYPGDRVGALITGLRDMLLDAYGGRQDFYLYHEFDAQKIYNLARNFEVAFWKLNQDKDSNGRLFLLSNATNTQLVVNLSFERLFGKLIGIQDQMAVVIANTTNRRIKNVIQSAASMVFLPI